MYPGTFPRSKDDNKRGAAVDKPGGRAAVQNVLDGLEKQANRDLVKLSKNNTGPHGHFCVCIHRQEKVITRAEPGSFLWAGG